MEEEKKAYKVVNPITLHGVEMVAGNIFAAKESEVEVLFIDGHVVEATPEEAEAARNTQAPAAPAETPAETPAPSTGDTPAPTADAGNATPESKEETPNAPSTEPAVQDGAGAATPSEGGAGKENETKADTVPTEKVEEKPKNWLGGHVVGGAPARPNGALRTSAFAKEKEEEAVKKEGQAATATPEAAAPGTPASA